MKKCKMCSNNIPNHRIYCSNQCKFSDPSYTKRLSNNIKNNPTVNVKCNHCDFSSLDENNLSGILTTHLKEHNISTSTPLDHFTKFSIEPKETISCPLCDWTTTDLKNKSGVFTVHLKKKHNIESFTQFTKENPKLKDLFSKQVKLEYVSLDKTNKGVQCKECGEWFKRLSNSHLQKHGLTPTQYRQKWLKKTISIESSKIQSEATRILNYKGITKTKTSSDELDLINKLKNINIEFEHQYKLNDRRFDFYFPKLNLLLELDGIAYHSDSIENLNMININSKQNDIIKNKLAKEANINLIRIRYNKSNFIFNNELEFLKLIELYKYTPSYNINNDTIIMNEAYLRSYNKEIGNHELRKYIKNIVKLIHLVHPEFPYPQSSESLEEVIEFIKNYDLNKLWNDNIVNGQCSYIGNSYLKFNFKSYWSSSYVNKKSPVEIWRSPIDLEKIIAWRAGINSKNETYDITLKTILTGISSARNTISFFKPLLAAAIYKNFLGNINKPTVIDPCAGFGGRLLGFKSIYPNGTYIGIEPNIETFNELSNLARNFSNIKLYNCKLEDYNDSIESDLTFTSIPYLNTEIYSNRIKQEENEWKNMIELLVTKYKNLLINISESSYSNIKFPYESKYLIKYGTSHFNKNKTNNYELLLKVK